MLLPSGQVIPVPCAKEVEKRVVRISLWDTWLCCSTSPCRSHLPVGRAPTSELLHRHVPPRALGQGGQQQGPTSPSD